VGEAIEYQSGGVKRGAEIADRERGKIDCLTERLEERTDAKAER